MKFPIKISPSILSADFCKLGEQAQQAQKGNCYDLHIDIMDGHYCHNFSFGIDVIPALKKNVNIPLVAHLEIDNPDAFIEDFANAGSDMIVVQEDTCLHLPRTIAHIKKRGAGAGIGISPHRGFEKIEANPEILEEIDLIIVLAAYPGFGGQPFSPMAIPKIKKAWALRDQHGSSFDIGVDGCVGPKTIPDIVKAGANYLISGSGVFNDRGVIENIQQLKETAESSI